MLQYQIKASKEVVLVQQVQNIKLVYTINRGTPESRIIIEDDHITIYDKDWKTKEYGKVKTEEN